MSKETKSPTPVLSEVFADPDVFTTSTGYKVKFKTVPYALVERLSTLVPQPQVPSFFNESKGEWQENPLDPKYLKSLENADELRQKKMMDAVYRFGATLLDERPEDDAWLPELRDMDSLMEGVLLSGMDLTNEVDKDIAFKQYVVFSSLTDITILMRNSTTTAEAVRDALKSFQNTKARQSR